MKKQKTLADLEDFTNAENTQNTNKAKEQNIDEFDTNKENYKIFENSSRMAKIALSATITTLNYQKLNQIAKKYKISKSEALDLILSNFFGKN